MFLVLMILPVCLGAAVDNTPQTSSCDHVCDTDYSPVCGSDGKDYSNECFFKAAKCLDDTLTLDHIGTCRPQLGTSIHDCPNVACIELWEPVCGTDGQTYSNTCFLHARNCDGNVKVAHEGACEDLVVSKRRS